MMRQAFPLFLFLLASFATPCAAQNNNLNGYVPPPLFGDTKLPPPDRTKDDIGLPVVSKPAPTPDNDLSEKNEPLIKERVFKQDSNKNVPAPVLPSTIQKEKPSLPKIDPADREIQRGGAVPVPPKKPGTQPQPSSSAPALVTTPAPMPVPSEGVVKGPKIMPSNKKQAVESETIFEPENDNAPLKLMEAIQSPAEKEIITETDKPAETDVREKQTVTPSVEYSFIPEPDGSRKLIMTYQTRQSELAQQQIDTLNSAIIPEMDKNIELRLMIQSYASPQESNISADRRMALDRALTVRNYLLEHEIPSNRIDVRSLGAEGNSEPLDRVELYLVN